MGQVSNEDQELVRQLYHPQTLGMIDCSCSHQTTTRRAKRLREEKKLFIIGKLYTKGRPADVYADRKWKSDNIDHEVELTRFIKHWEMQEFRRGRDVDPELRPDAQLGNCCIENDRGTESIDGQVKGRLNYYRDSECFPLFICPSRTRANNILHLGFDFILVTTMQEALKTSCTCWHIDGEIKLREVLQRAKEKLDTRLRNP